MPTNLCYLPRDRFSPDQKSRYRQHQLSSQRGDRRPFLFRAGDDRGDPGGALFGRRTDVGSHLDSRRHTRRSDRATATGMMTKMVQDISGITGVAQENIWILISATWTPRT